MSLRSQRNVLLVRLILSTSSLAKRSKSSDMSVLFYGSDNFSLPSLRSLHSNLLLPVEHENKIIKSLDICTKSTRNEVGSYSIESKLNLQIWPYELPANKYDIGVVVSFGELLPRHSIDSCSKGILNAHASLLPKLRGAAPVFRAILDDYKETGVTIMRIRADKFDVGDIVLQEKIELGEDSKAIDLYDELSRLSSVLLMKCLANLDDHLARSIKQNDEEATKAFKVKPGENRVRWSEMDLKHVYKLYRAFDGFLPIYTRWTNGCEMKLFKMIPLKRALEMQQELNHEFASSNDAKPTGTIVYSKHKKIVCILCRDRNWAGFSEVGLKGHKVISAKQFNNGHLMKASSQQNKEGQIVLNDAD